MGLRLRILLLNFTWCGGLLLGSASQAANVLKQSSSRRDTFLVSQNTLSKWKVGTRACAHSNKKKIACGTIVKTSDGNAVFQVDDEEDAKEMVIGSVVHDEDFDYEEGSSASQVQLSIEGGGAGGLYTVYFSVRPNEVAAFNFGFSHYSPRSAIPGSSSGLSFTTFPVTLSMFNGRGGHYFELTAGVVPVLVKASEDASAVSAAMAGLNWLWSGGVGYRYWPLEGGFHFRAMVDFMKVPSASGFGSATLWGGVSLGYGF